MKKPLLFLILFLQSLITAAQNPADVEQTFGPYPGFNHIVSKIVTQADGKILVGGNFTTYLGNPENYLVRLNKDGSKDTSFNIGTGFNRSVSAIVVLPDGKILIGGSFTTYNGAVQNRIIRLNSDGSKDATFNIGTGFDNSIQAIALQPDGKILVSGYFSKYQNSYQNRLIRLNPDGTKDPSLIAYQSGSILAIVVQPDGKIILGGGFRTFADESQNLLIRLNPNGTRDTTFDVGSGFEKDPSASFGSVNTVVLQPDGKILVGGDFRYYKKELNEYIIRLNTDGSKDATFNTENRIGSFSYVQCILTQPDGKIVVGGSFTEFRRQNDPQNRLVRFNANGTKDETFKIGTGFNDLVETIALQNDGQLLIGGVFTTYQDLIQNRLVQLNPNGSKDILFNETNGFSHVVNAIAVQNDGKILAGGEFTTYNGASQNKLIRFNSDGSKDETFDIGTGFTHAVSSITMQANQKILVAGDFLYFDGSRRDHLIRLESGGYQDSSFKVSAVIQRNSLIVVQPDQKILVAKDFSIPYQQPQQKGLIRLNSDGSTDTSFILPSQFGTGIIYALAVQNDGKIVVGGYFTTKIGAAQNYLIRLNSDGSTDTSFNVGIGFDNTVDSVLIQSDGKILIGGSFTKYQEIPVKSFIRLNSDGSIDPTFALDRKVSNANPILQKDGKIILGLNRYNSDGTIDNSFQIGTKEFNGYIRAVALQPNGQVLVGGEFTKYKDISGSAYLVRLKGTELSLSNDEFTQKNNLFSLWPNPTKNVLNINSLNETNYSVKIYNILGKLLYTKENVNAPIDVSSFTSGLYLIKIKAGNGEISQKFIKI
ncbi:T9SS type A sorting domain-containing protein [Flavobacterium poyangense]|uniref:T9SS type A sorting domain-containing protein n=1 Tax=Flavobacterium poyangense TaxID=2204302 RepID=UPI0014241BA8|nr:T9SS type A sorting domain-containing protein [Flavobacterium sp. JXAS1]